LSVFFAAIGPRSYPRPALDFAEIVGAFAAAIAEAPRTIATVELTAPGVFELGLVLLLAALAGWLARGLGLPAVIGYLAVGLAISPFTPGYVADRAQLAFLADVGVVILLFEVGIEIDLARIWRDHGPIAWLAPLQVLLTGGVALAALVLAGVSPLGAAFVAIGVAMSSSVVIVNITRSRRKTTTRETDQALLGWSVLQDITGVTLAVVALAIADAAQRPIILAAVGAAAFLAATIAAAWLLPRILRRLGGEDLLLIVSVGVGLTLAGFGALIAEIPLALAAFAAGLVVAEGPEAAAVRRRLLPFRDLFAVLFFVLLGSLIDPGALGRGVGWLAILLGLVAVAKSGVVAVLARIARVRADWAQLGIGLGQVGEFSFVLASAALTLGLIAEDLYAAVLGSVVVSIAISTVLVRQVGRGSASPAAEALQ
jgi:CPA2 family monovalent cation:H+ antiporter-2